MTVRQPGRQSTSARVGEVIAADSITFTVQCYELYGSPPLGSFIRAGHPGIYGVVNNVRTEPLDPSRPVLARGRDHETEDEVLLENPHLSRLLTSRFDAVTIGSAGPSGFASWLPPLPPRVHAFVYDCGEEEYAMFAADPGFLARLARAECPASDDVVRSCLLAMVGGRPDGPDVALRAGRALAAQLAGDVARINAILSGVGK